MDLVKAVIKNAEGCEIANATIEERETPITFARVIKELGCENIDVMNGDTIEIIKF